MYQLPENPSAVDIIALSVNAHPSLFREALITQASAHEDYEELSTNERAKQGARSSKLACLKVYDLIGNWELTPRECANLIVEETGPAAIALNVACKLQCLPPHVRTAAATTL